MEKNKMVGNGYSALGVALVCIVTAIALFVYAANQVSPTVINILAGVACILAAVIIFTGLFIIEPNYGMVLTFFGEYVGTAKTVGLKFANPLYKKLKVNLRAESLESQKLKVNDKIGNPIEIACVLVWQIADTYKAVFEVQNINTYIRNQTEAALRHLASEYAYDNFEDEHATVSLRSGGQKIIELLQNEMNDRLSNAGINVLEARISHLAYAPEIAGAMLQRQQATAIVAARTKIVEGAVGMVETALEMLNAKGIVSLDDDRKAVMVSNLMVVLCGEKAATPILNTGTLHQ
jgi:regulator of protease activity HflC (stomatin/prohibitin superfamily)